MHLSVWDFSNHLKDLNVNLNIHLTCFDNYSVIFCKKAILGEKLFENIKLKIFKEPRDVSLLL